MGRRGRNALGIHRLDAVGEGRGLRSSGIHIAQRIAGQIHSQVRQSRTGLCQTAGANQYVGSGCTGCRPGQGDRESTHGLVGVGNRRGYCVCVECTHSGAQVVDRSSGTGTGRCWISRKAGLVSSNGGGYVGRVTGAVEAVHRIAGVDCHRVQGHRGVGPAGGVGQGHIGQCTGLRRALRNDRGQ